MLMVSFHRPTHPEPADLGVARIAPVAFANTVDEAADLLERGSD
ncbi:hypothetical protein [Asanoa sp. NPDC050611]